jgi:hypothetical protein
MLTYLLGPFAAFLPSRWRNALPLAGHIRWLPATMLSGALQILSAIVALGYWYLYLMGRALGALVEKVDEHQASAGALILFALNPLTWLLFYFFLEGAVRLCSAAFTGIPYGTLPLYLLDRAVLLVTNRNSPSSQASAPSNVQSFVESIRERLLLSQLTALPDELRYPTAGSQAILDICASRRKPDWLPPKIVRVDEIYYRLEELIVEKGPRPFRYRLTQLERGVPSRSVLLYNSAQSLPKH